MVGKQNTKVSSEPRSLLAALTLRRFDGPLSASTRRSGWQKAMQLAVGTRPTAAIRTPKTMNV
jgi:hypothetical protein